MLKTASYSIAILLAAILAVFLYDRVFWMNYIGSLQGSGPQFATALERYPTTEKVDGAFTEPLPQRDVDSTLFQEAVDYAEEMASDSLLIWHDGAIQLERYWNGHDASLRPETASMHKSVMALVVGLAIEEGHIGSIDDPVETYLPEWQGEPRGQVTVGDLLTMSSGFVPYPFDTSPFSDSRRLIWGMRLERMMLDLELSTPPDNRFHYANVNSQLLGLVLERATGKRYADFLSEQLWQPLGADDAHVWLDRNGGLARTYSALLARPRDWLRLGLLFKNEGAVEGQQVVPANWISEMTAPSRHEPNYGYQIWLSNEDTRKRYYNQDDTGVGFVISEPFLSDDVIYFDGIGGQRVFVSAQDDFVVVRTGPPRTDWDDAKLPNSVARALRSQSSLSPKE